MTRTSTGQAARLWLPLSFAAASALGCGGSEDKAPEAAPPPPPAAPVDRTLTLSAASARGGFAIAIVHANGPIPVNEPFDVELVVQTPDGAPFGGADSITLDARMPAHGHGMLRDVELVEAGDGRWRAEGLLFHMVGAWQFHVDVRRGAFVERAQVAYELQH